MDKGQIHLEGCFYPGWRLMIGYIYLFTATWIYNWGLGCVDFGFPRLPRGSRKRDKRSVIGCFCYISVGLDGVRLSSRVASS